MLPKDSIYLASEGGSYNPDTHPISWNIDNLKVGDKISKKITIKYPEDKFQEGSSAINKTEATGTNISRKAATIPAAQVTTIFSKPSPPNLGAIGFQKTSEFEYRNIGQSQKFYIRKIKKPAILLFNNL